MLAKEDQIVSGGGHVEDVVRFWAAIGTDEWFWIGVRRGGGRRRLRRELSLEIDIGELVGEASGTGVGQIAKANHGELLFREAQQLRAVAEKSAAMLNGWKSAVRGDEEAKGVLDGLSVVEHAGRLHFLEQRPFAQSVRVEI